MTVDPRALAKISEGRRSVLVTGTNGKTTTTRLLVAAVGGEVATNATGANLRSGIVAAYADSASDRAVIEVDELRLPDVLTQVTPEIVVCLNLTRDQLDRMHEVRRIVDRWRAALKQSGAIVVANVQDPNVVQAVIGCRTVWFDPGFQWRSDASACPACGELLAWTDQDWSCDCGLAMPRPDFASSQGRVTWAGDQALDLRLSLPGAMNEANAVAALAAAEVFGIPIPDALERMRRVSSVQGRYGQVRVGAGSARLLLAKNPASWDQVITLVEGAPLIISVDAEAADGRDTSWLYDVAFERLRVPWIGVSGSRRHDMALRLHYAGMEVDVDDDPDRLAVRAPAGPLTVAATYSSFKYFSRRERLP